MKRVNKMLRALAVLVAMCMMMATVASAAENGQVWLSVTESANGEETSALVVTNTTVTDGLIKITYDSEKLTYKGVMVSSEHVAMHSVNAETAGEVVIAWVAPEAYESDGSAVTLIEVQFTGTGAEPELTGAVHDAEGNEISIGSVDTSALEEAVENAKSLNEEDFTEESWTALEEALEQAEDVLKDPTATQEEVDAAAEELNATAEALEEKPEETTQPEVDTTELEKAIAKAEKLDKKDYTAKSYKAVEAALKVAKSVLADENATQEEVDNAADALNKAIKALVPTTGKNPGTGDDFPLVPVIAIAALALIGIVALVILGCRNKKNGRYAK